jgi:hypothetical protein
MMTLTMRKVGGFKALHLLGRSEHSPVILPLLDGVFVMGSCCPSLNMKPCDSLSARRMEETAGQPLHFPTCEVVFRCTRALVLCWAKVEALLPLQWRRLTCRFTLTQSTSIAFCRRSLLLWAAVELYWTEGWESYRKHSERSRYRIQIPRPEEARRR